jgi:L-ribulose-5-phosphate 4-epimerase
VNDQVSRETLEDVLWAAQMVSRTDLAPATQGNFSARDPQSGRIVITPHDQWYDQMTTSDLTILDLDGTVLAGPYEPSFDHRVHCAIYRERPDVFSVIHTEPPYVNAFGAVGRDIPPVTTTGLKSGGGPVPVMAFEWVRQEAFARRMMSVMGTRYAVIWRNHGLLVVGNSVKQALARTFGVEFNAKVAYMAAALGTAQTLTYAPDGTQIVA